MQTRRLCINVSVPTYNLLEARRRSHRDPFGKSIDRAIETVLGGEAALEPAGLSRAVALERVLRYVASREDGCFETTLYQAAQSTRWLHDALEAVCRGGRVTIKSIQSALLHYEGLGGLWYDAQWHRWRVHEDRDPIHADSGDDWAEPPSSAPAEGSPPSAPPAATRAAARSEALRLLPGWLSEPTDVDSLVARYQRTTGLRGLLRDLCGGHPPTSPALVAALEELERAGRVRHYEIATGPGGPEALVSVLWQAT